MENKKGCFRFTLLAVSFVVLTAVLLIAGCTPSGSTEAPAGPEPEAAQPVGEQPPAEPAAEEPAPAPTDAPAPAEPRRGPGDFDLADPQVGLDGLRSFRQSLEVVSNAKTTRYARSLVREPYAELFQMETADQDGGPLALTAGRLGEAYLLKSSAEAPCQVVIDPGYQQGFHLQEPASLLPLVFGAESAGQEEVNGIAAARYDFDARALHRYGDAEAGGSVWVAVDGGYVVRYTLEVTAPGGSETWNYELSEANTLAGLELPEGCALPLVDLPVPDSAQEVVRRPDVVSFATAEDAAAVGAFYEQHFTAEGWEKLPVFQSLEEGVVLVYRTQAGDRQSTALIDMHPSAAGLDVTVQMLEKTIVIPVAE